MRLGLNLGYWGGGNDADNLAVAQEADRLGYSVCWAAEAYGSDAPTVLSWVAAQTERIDVGAAVMQIPARSAAMTAMTAATLDTLSGGRFRLGLGRRVLLHGLRRLLRLLLNRRLLRLRVLCRLAALRLLAAGGVARFAAAEEGVAADDHDRRDEGAESNDAKSAARED